MDQSGHVLPQNGLAENKIFMGVTTAIGGEGGTPVEVDQIADYFAGLERTGISINFGSYFSETQARVAILTLPEAIRKMTSWPATRMRLESRGMIKTGMWADVVVFDYEKIDDRATFEKPLLSPVGIDYVLVNGEVVADHGKHTGARPGKVIYGAGRELK